MRQEIKGGTTMTDIRREMQTRARLSYGLLNVLKDDVDCINIDTDNNDLVSLTESIIETKITLQKMVDNITELEYIVYLSRRGKNISLYEN